MEICEIMTVFKHNQVNGLSQVIDHTFMMKILSPEHFIKLQELNQQEAKRKEQILFPLWQKD